MTDVAAVQDPPTETGRRPAPWLTEARAFVRAVERASAGDSGVRAALRSGLGKDLDDVPRMHRVIAPLLPPTVVNDDDAQRAFYTVAALIATHKRGAAGGEPESPAPSENSAGAPEQAVPDTEDTTAGGGTEESQGPEASAKRRRRLYGESLGSTFAAAVAQGPREGIRESAAETRMNLLTRQSTAGLHRHLPAAVRQLCDRGTPPDWARLLVDLRAWPRDRRNIGRRWLQDFYRTRHRRDLEAARQSDDTSPVTEPAAE